MKITCGQHSDDLKLFDDNGNDVTNTMTIASIELKFLPNERNKALIEVYVDEVDIDFDETITAIDRPGHKKL